MIWLIIRSMFSEQIGNYINRVCTLMINEMNQKRNDDINSCFGSLFTESPNYGCACKFKFLPLILSAAVAVV